MRALLLAITLAPAAHAAGDAAKGKELYLKSCSQCHGEAGDGKGPAAARMYVKPRDFTTGAYKIRTTPNGEMPTDSDLHRAIAEGLPGSTMPAWKDAYSAGDIESLAAFIKTFSERFPSEKPSRVFSLKGRKKPTPESLAEGRKIFLEMQCNSCHGNEGRADGPSAPTLTDDLGNPIRPANFHKGWNLRGGHKPEDIFRTILTGLNGTPMPSYLDALGDNPEGLAKAWHLANYVRSLSPDLPPTGEVLRSRPHAGQLPKDPSDPTWEQAPPTGFRLLGQIIEDPRQFQPSIDYLEARSLYNQDVVAFLLQWDDPVKDPNADQKGRPDAAQIQVPMALIPDSQEGERPYFLEGDASHPVQLWRWDAKSGKASCWKSTGLSSKKEETPCSVRVSSAAYADGRWSLVLTQEREPTSRAGLAFHSGLFVPIAFSAWDGGNGDEGAKRSISAWYYLLLEPQKSKLAYAYPLAALVLVGGLEALLLGLRRRRTHV